MSSSTNATFSNGSDLTEITERLTKLHSAVLCDALDALGFRRQALSHKTKSISPSAKLIGNVRTLDSYAVDRFPDKPYAKELEALDTLVDGDVVVLATNGDVTAAVWGELLSIAARSKGARGAITDGLTRDASRIKGLNFPVYAQGISSYDSLGRSEVTAYDTTIQCDGVTVQSGDVVFGDDDGVVIIPRAVLSVVVEKAETKTSREEIVEAEFRKGRKAADVFAEYGIL